MLQDNRDELTANATAMSEPITHRRRAAILAAVIVGYSKLIGEDEL
jgi:hypothetical protein